MGAGTWIGAGLGVYRKHWGRMVLGILALVGFHVLLVAMGGGITYFLGPIGVPDIGEEISPGIAVLLAILAFTVGTMLYLGYYYYVLKLVRGERPGIVDDLLYPFRRPLAVIGVTLLYALAVIFGLVFLIVPGIVLAAKFYFADIALLDRRLGVVEAMSESSEITRGHKLSLFLLMLFFQVVLGLPLDAIGAALGDVGRFVAEAISYLIVTPWGTASAACAYIDLLEEAQFLTEEATPSTPSAGDMTSEGRQ